MMTVQPLVDITTGSLVHNEATKKTALTGSESFTEALQAAKDLVEMNKVAAQDVENKTMDFMMGKNDNIVDLMVAQEKSGILLQYSLQVRNGLLSAYKEIINLSI